jgi:hypothetical protein
VRGGGETVNFSFSLFDVCIQRAALSGGKKKSKQVWRLRLHNKTANTRNKTKKLKTKKKGEKVRQISTRERQRNNKARQGKLVYTTQTIKSTSYFSFFLSFSFEFGLWRRKTEKNQALLVCVALPIADPIFSLLRSSF